MAGLVASGEPSAGEPVVAVFRPTAVSVYRDAPHGSPRNVVEVEVTQVEPLGDLFRIRSERLSADVTATAAAELERATVALAELED